MYECRLPIVSSKESELPLSSCPFESNLACLFRSGSGAGASLGYQPWPPPPASGSPPKSSQAQCSTLAFRRRALAYSHERSCPRCCSAESTFVAISWPVTVMFAPVHSGTLGSQRPGPGCRAAQCKPEWEMPALTQLSTRASRYPAADCGQLVPGHLGAARKRPTRGLTPLTASEGTLSIYPV